MKDVPLARLQLLNSSRGWYDFSYYGTNRGQAASMSPRRILGSSEGYEPHIR